MYEMKKVKMIFKIILKVLKMKKKMKIKIDKKFIWYGVVKNCRLC